MYTFRNVRVCLDVILLVVGLNFIRCIALQDCSEIIHCVPEKARLRLFHHDNSVRSYCIAEGPLNDLRKFPDRRH